MEPRELVKDLDLAALFAAGAASALSGTGATEKQAEDFVFGVCKEAAMGDAYGEDDTFWKRNKGWIVPVVASALAFKIGGDAGRYGRPDRNYLSNAFSDLWGRAKKLMGYNAAHELYKRVQENLMRKSREKDDEEE